MKLELPPEHDPKDGPVEGLIGLAVLCVFVVLLCIVICKCSPHP